jgi:uncharacterized Zn-binding protein involved in type VI secretion
MTYLKPAIHNVSGSISGQIIGNVAKTVYLDGQLVVLEGSANSAGATVLAPSKSRTVFIEGKAMASEGDALSDGTIILSRK